MNKSIIKGKWNEVKGQVQEQWGKLTDDDLDEVEGRREQLVGKIRQAYGRERAEVEQEIEKWEGAHDLR